MSSAGNKKAVLAALLANLGIAVAKFVGFGFTSSSSMLAEGVHSLADTGNQILLLFGARRSLQEPTKTHPFGFGRERYFWAFVVSIVLFTMGSMFALFEGVEKLTHPSHIESAGWAIAILTVAVLMESLSLRTALAESRPLLAGRSWIGFIRQSKAPELPVLLLEDSAALVGLLTALAAVVMSTVTGSGRWDGGGSILIGLLLAVVAFVLAAEMKSLLIGESASDRDEDAIRDAITSAPFVRRLIHMRTLHLGPDEVLVAAKADFDPDLGFAELAATIDDVEARIRARVPAAVVIYIEPDVGRSPVSPEAAQGATEGAGPDPG